MSFFASPLFVDLLLWGLYGLFAVALALVIWSACRSTAMRHRVGWGTVAVCALLCGILAFTALTASTHPLLVNGMPYTDKFWLRGSDMLIDSSLVLMLLAAISVLASASGLGRRFPRQFGK